MLMHLLAPVENPEQLLVRCRVVLLRRIELSRKVPERTDRVCIWALTKPSATAKDGGICEEIKSLFTRLQLGKIQRGERIRNRRSQRLKGKLPLRSPNPLRTFLGQVSETRCNLIQTRNVIAHPLHETKEA